MQFSATQVESFWVSIPGAAVTAGCAAAQAPQPEPGLLARKRVGHRIAKRHVRVRCSEFQAGVFLAPLEHEVAIFSSAGDVGSATPTEAAHETVAGLSGLSETLAETGHRRGRRIANATPQRKHARGGRSAGVLEAPAWPGEDASVRLALDLNASVDC